MRTLQRNRRNGDRATARTGLCSKALMFLLTAFVICAFAQTVQLNSLLAEAASVSESVMELRDERELISAGYASYFRVIEKYGSN